jgi:hypothetical protein
MTPKNPTPGLPWLAYLSLPVALFSYLSFLPSAEATPPRPPDETVECELLIVGAGLAGSAAAYEGLLAGRTVCLTEITDWVGGQLSAQGTSALDEVGRQRSLRWYSRGYNNLRARIFRKYGKLNPGDCWVSVSCFIPSDGHQLVWQMLRDAEDIGKGKLHWFPNTVIKELDLSSDGKQIQAAIAIQHQPASTSSALNTVPLSRTIEDAYRYSDSSQFKKRIIRFTPEQQQRRGWGDGEDGEKSQNSELRTPNSIPHSPFPEWFVIEATETGELIALADVPYRLGLDARSYLDPSSPVTTNDPYCTQGFTYTFAMEQTATPQPQKKPAFYEQYEPYYGYDPDRRKADFNFVFTYRRIWGPINGPRIQAGPFTVNAPMPGHISMQNWVWGNDYRPGTAQDNLIYTQEQLRQNGQHSPGAWLGGLRTNTLRRGEEIALGFYYWLVAGTTDSQLGSGVKQPHPNHRLLAGLGSPMGTVHGLSKYPYIREARRIIGRPTLSQPNGFAVTEIDISARNYRDEFYRQTLPEDSYRHLWLALAGLETYPAVRGVVPVDKIQRRTRSTIYPDSVGIAQYAIDFHPCMTLSPPEAAGNMERAGVRQAHGSAYPGQIPLRAMIPKRIDNLLVAGKSIATSFIAAAAYRVHSFEWSSGAAAGITAAFSLSHGIFPYELVDELPNREPKLESLRQILERSGNPTEFPNTSIFNLQWENWKTW